MILNAVGIPIRLLVAFVADAYIGPLATILPCFLVAAITFYSWLAVNDESGMYGFTCAFGMAAGGIQTLFLAALSSFATNPNTAGVRIGMVCTIISFSALTGPPIGGAIINVTIGGYEAAEIWAGTSMATGFVILLGVTGYKYKTSCRS